MKLFIINMVVRWKNIDFTCIARIRSADSKNSDYTKLSHQIKIATVENSIFMQLEVVFPGLELIKVNNLSSTINFSHDISHLIKNIDVDNIMISCNSHEDLNHIKDQIDQIDIVKLSAIGFDTQYKKTLKIQNHEYIISTTSELVNIHQVRQYIKVSIFIDNRCETVYLPKHFLKHIIQKSSSIKHINLNNFFIGLGVEIFTMVLNSIGIAAQLEGWSYVKQKLSKQLKINLLNKNFSTYFLLPEDSVNFKQLIISKISIPVNKRRIITPSDKLQFDIDFELCQMTIDKIDQLDIGKIILSANTIKELQCSINCGKSMVDSIVISQEQLKIIGVRYNEN